MSELKPCPLCNSENIQLMEAFFAGYGPDCLCMKCGCKADKKAWQNRTQSQWISVADEVPKIGQNYDGYHYSGRHANCGAFIGNGWDEKSIRETMQIKGYSHWSPIPLSPKEQGQ